MSIVNAAFVRETSTTTGTGTYTLAGAATGFRTFVAGVGNGNECYYSATDGTDWEEGIGTVTDAASDTLSRNTILASSNAGAAVNWAAGTRTLRCTFPAVAGPVIGAITAYAGTAAPTGWLLCYGQAISRTTYAELFDILSTTYGTGDGSTTFNLPDIRGRVIAGQDDMGGVSANRLTGVTGSVNGDTLGGTGGAETHTLAETEIPAHTHTVSHDTGSSTAGNSAIGGANNAADSSKTSGSTGGGGAHNNVQPTIILNYIIFAGV